MRKLNFLRNNNSHKLFAGLIALVLVAGMTGPAFAQIPQVPICEISPTSANVEITQVDGSAFVEKTITCLALIEQIELRHDCSPYDVDFLVGPELEIYEIEVIEQIISFGSIESQHCTVTFEVTDVSGAVFELEQELWINMNQPIGGTVGSMSTTSLLVAGAQSNMGLWSLALVGIVGAAAAITYKVKSKSEQ